MKNKILFLGYSENRVIDFLRRENSMITTNESLNLKKIKDINPDHIISYGYRHIITPDIIQEYPNIVNLHIAYLPWNRGANPCFWSILENTPKGISIHYIDKGIDTGDILIQKEVNFNENETIGNYYRRLKDNIESLFIESWEDIIKENLNPMKQMSKGTFHKKSDIEKYESILGLDFEKGNTPIKRIKKEDRRC